MTEQPKISDEAVEVVARRLHRSRYTSGPVNDEHDELRWTQLLFDDERDGYRRRAREHLEAAYPLLRQQWEAELSECDEMIQLPIFFEGQPYPYVRCVRKPLGHPMPHRSEDGMEWSPVTEVDRG